MASRILDMGDMLTLIEQAEKTFDAEQAAKAAAKLSGQGGEFTLDDFLEQMQQVRKMGSLTKMLGMLPGMSGPTRRSSTARAAPGSPRGRVGRSPT
jgi:signal recognition particle subunit SRP54